MAEQCLDSSLSLVKKLAHNDKTQRDQGVAMMSQWISKRNQVEEIDMMKIWKGLFYCMLQLQIITNI